MKHKTKRSPYTCVLFDLDGTLTDSAPGIIDSLHQAFAQTNWPIPSAHQINDYLGPPLHVSLQKFAGMNPTQTEKTIELYRTHYDLHGAKNNALYPGIQTLLGVLTAAKIPLAIATSKPQKAARLILEHFHIDHHFTYIAGASQDGTISTKAQVIETALVGLTETGIDINAPVMIGDRSYDIEGAHAHNIPTIMVEWGYGSFEESLGAHATVHSPEQLKHLLVTRNQKY